MGELRKLKWRTQKTEVQEGEDLKTEVQEGEEKT